MIIHERHNSKVHLIDCMEYMKTIPDKYYDLSVVDPPYGIGDFQTTGDANKYKKRKEKQYGDVKDWNMSIPDKMYFEELERISKEQIIWGANYYNSFSKGGAIIWDKENDSSERYSICEIASISMQKKVSIFRYKWNGFLQADMKNKEQRIHSCQKPIALYDWIYKNYLPNGGKVIDTHLGSGSNRISAHKRGNIIFDACELDTDYFNDGNKRYDEFLAKYLPASLEPMTAQGQLKLI